MINIPSEVRYLSYAGIIPIFFGLIGSFELNFINDNLNIWFTNFAILFSALILSFLGGCLYIFQIILNSKFNKKDIFLSMMPSIWAAISLQLPMSCFLLAIGFLGTLEIERKISKTIKFPYWWLKMRFRLTTAMVILLLIMGLNV